MKNNEIRDRLVELFIEADKFNENEVCDSFEHCGACSYAQYGDCSPRVFADYFIAHGVTFAEDTNVPTKWIPISEPPTEADEYIVMIKGAGSSTTLLYDPIKKIWFEEDARGNVERYVITHWMPMPEPPMKKKRIIGTAKLREKSGMSQKALGKIVGKSQQAVAKWETGVSEPDIETMFTLAAVFGCTLEELFEEEIKNGNAGKTPNTD